MRLLICCLFLLAGCTSEVGHSFDIDASSKLKPGVSTEADAESLLGKAAGVVENPVNHHKLFYWSHTEGHMFSGNAERLAISFDQNGRMIRIIQRSQV